MQSVCRCWRHKFSSESSRPEIAFRVLVLQIKGGGIVVPEECCSDTHAALTAVLASTAVRALRDAPERPKRGFARFANRSNPSLGKSETRLPPP